MVIYHIYSPEGIFFLEKGRQIPIAREKLTKFDKHPQNFFWNTNPLANYKLLPPVINFILSVYIQHFSYLPDSYFQFFLYLLLAKYT